MEWVAISISLAALLLSGFTFWWSSIRATPKPKLEGFAVLDGTTSEQADDEGRIYTEAGVELSIANRGNGTAHDVVLDVPSIDGKWWPVMLNGIEPNSQASRSFGVDRDILFSGPAFTPRWTEYPSRKRQSMPVELYVHRPH